METELIQDIVAIPAIIGLVEVIKRVTGVNDKYAPVIAVGIGVVASFGLQFFGETDVYIALVRGIVLGLSSVGLFSGAKNTLEGIGLLKTK